MHNNQLKWVLIMTLAATILLGYGGLCEKEKKKVATGSSVAVLSAVLGQAYVLTSDNQMAPAGGGTVTVEWSELSLTGIIGKGPYDTKFRTARVLPDGSYTVPDIPRNTPVTVTITSVDSTQSVENITTTEDVVYSSGVLRGRGKKIGRINKAQEFVMNTFDDTSLPKCQITVPANAVTADVDNVYLTPTHQGENLPPLPDGYIFIAGGDFSAPSAVTFASGKEATPYIILPDNVRAEDLSTANIRLMEFVNGNWVITTSLGFGKVYTSGDWAGYIGPNSLNPAKLKGIRPWAWVVSQSTTAQISGTVRDTAGNPIRGAMLFGGGVRANTKPDGTYIMKNISVVRANTLVPVNATAVGYQLANKFINCSPGATVNNTDFVLEPITAVQTGEISGKVTNSADSAPVYGAMLTLQTAPGIRGLKYDNKNTPTDLTDDTFYVIPPAGVTVTQYKWMLGLPDNSKFTSSSENGASVILNQLVTEATNAGKTLNLGTYKVELEITYTGGRKAVISGGFLLKLSGLTLYIADIRLPVSLQDQLLLKAVTDAQGNYRFGSLPIGESFTLYARAEGFIAANPVTVAALTGGAQRTQNFALAALASDTTAPTQPGNVTGTARSSSSIFLAWTVSSDNVGIDYYRVYRNGIEIGKTSANSYLDSGLTSNITYTYQIGAFDKANNSAMSNIISVLTSLTIQDTTPPSAPANLTAAVAGTSQINLSWNASSDNVGVLNYIVYGSTNGITYQQLTTNNTTSYSNMGLASGMTYWYKVTAQDAAGNESAYSNVINAATTAVADTTAPSVPTGLTATAVSLGQIDLAWSASTDNVGVSGYKVYRNSIYLASVAGASYGDSGLSENMTYTYKVSAYDAAGNSSAQSNSVSTTTTITGSSSAPPLIQTRGWSKEGYDLGWTNFYPITTSRAPTGLALKWNTLYTGTALTADVNNDGQLEVVVLSGANLKIFNGIGTNIGSMVVPSGSMLLEDATGDGVPDVLIGYKDSSDNLKIDIYNVASQQLVKTLSRGASGYDSGWVPRAVKGDKVIALCGAGYSLAPRGLSVLSLSSGIQTLYYGTGGGQTNSAIGDLNKDGKLDVAFYWFTPHNGAGWIDSGDFNETDDDWLWAVAVDETGTELFKNRLDTYGSVPIQGGFGGVSVNGAYGTMIADLDGDGNSEVIGLEHHDPTYYPGTNMIYKLNAAGAKLASFTGPYNGDWWGSYHACADIDNDGKQEIIASVKNGTIYILKYDLTLLRASSSGIGNVLALTDFNGDGLNDIIVYQPSTNKIRVLKNDFTELYSYILSGEFGSVIISDLGNNGLNEIIVSTSQGVFILGE